MDLNIGIVQFDIQWEKPELNKSKIQEILSTREQLPRLIVLPEMFLTGFSCDVPKIEISDGATDIEWLKQLSSDLGSSILGSLRLKENDGSIRNRLVLTSPTKEVQFYDKRHLFSLSSEARNFTRGHERKVFQVNSWSLLPQVCYDLRFPVWARNSFHYDLMVNVANWPASRRTAWRSLLIARAIENQAYVVGVNRIGIDGNGLEYSGDSMVVDPLGQVILDAESKSGFFTAKLRKDDLLEIRKKFPFLNDMDAFALDIENK